VVVLLVDICEEKKKVDEGRRRWMKWKINDLQRG
jgi:hypothetical protein